MGGLTEFSYYSLEANTQYMSVSQYKNFMECEAAALAEIRGEYYPLDKEALLAGSYLHAWNEGTLEQFKEKHHDVIFNRKGEPYAPFKKVDEMIKVLSEDEFCMAKLEGEKEVIRIAEFAGTPWKIKMDVLNEDYGFFTDLKSTRSISELQWSEKWRRRVSFVEMYDYMIQAAVYAEIERISSGRDYWLQPMMVAVSKEAPPDKEVISLADDARLNDELNNIEANMPRILAVKNGIEKPRRCGKCMYCRMTKRISKAINYIELGGDIYGVKNKEVKSA